MLAASTLMIPLPAPSQLATFQATPKASHLNSPVLRSSSSLTKHQTGSLSCSSMVLRDDDHSPMNSESILLDELDRMDSGYSSQSLMDECRNQDLIILSSIDDMESNVEEHDSDSDSSLTSPQS